MISVQKVKIAVCQVPDIPEEMGIALQWIEKFVQEARRKVFHLFVFRMLFTRISPGEDFGRNKCD